jgi:DNA-binding NtrC family response regulator
MKRATGGDAQSRAVFERSRIESALKRHGGNKRRAAGELGIPESTLRWKINNLGIEMP